MRAQLFTCMLSLPHLVVSCLPAAHMLARAELFALPLEHHARDVTFMEGKVFQTTHPPGWRWL